MTRDSLGVSIGPRRGEMPESFRRWMDSPLLYYFVVLVRPLVSAPPTVSAPPSVSALPASASTTSFPSCHGVWGRSWPRPSSIIAGAYRSSAYSFSDLTRTACSGFRQQVSVSVKWSSSAPILPPAPSFVPRNSCPKSYRSVWLTAYKSLASCLMDSMRCREYSVYETGMPSPSRLVFFSFEPIGEACH